MLDTEHESTVRTSYKTLRNSRGERICAALHVRQRGRTRQAEGADIGVVLGLSVRVLMVAVVVQLAALRYARNTEC
eukprot:6192033-Pleurochrysis_carterae.AAC.1